MASAEAFEAAQALLRKAQRAAAGDVHQAQLSAIATIEATADSGDPYEAEVGIEVLISAPKDQPAIATVRVGDEEYRAPLDWLDLGSGPGD